VVMWAATFPLASLPVPRVASTLVWVYHLGLGVLTLWLVIGEGRSARSFLRALWDRFAALLALIHPYGLAAGSAGLVLLVAYFSLRPDGRLHLVFLDTGRGDALFLRTPGGRQVLIDGGYDSRQTLAELGRQMPFWDRTLDLVILTSPDDDRLNGLLPVLERFDVTLVGDSPESRDAPSAAQWQRVMQQRAPGTSSVLHQGDGWDLEPDLRLSVLWPPPDREGPLVLQISYGEVRMLLMGDAPTTVEKALVATYGPALHSRVLQLPRQGRRTCCSVELLQAVAPEVAVVQGSRLDDITRAKLMDAQLYTTASRGAVEIISDGTYLDVRTRR
jgi:competence protein ComEC